MLKWRYIFHEYRGGKELQAAMNNDENTYILDPESPVEMTRLIDLDRVLTKAMGGALSGAPELPMKAQLLDLSCGPGGWVLDVAYANPDSEVAGIDISKTMIDYANARARTQGLTNASFGVMDITQTLDFSDATFDLVNARLLVGVLKRHAWEPFIAECSRILKPGGILRLTEPIDALGVSNSVAYEKLNQFVYQLFWQSGYGFSVDGHSLSMSITLPWMLRKVGYQNVRSLGHIFEFSAGTEGYIDTRKNIQALQYQAKASMSRMNTPQEAERIEELYQDALRDMFSDEFRGAWHLTTILGTKP
jgi:ubiquinone/menaquinone biosynthesis C-methylase UbiE